MKSSMARAALALLAIPVALTIAGNCSTSALASSPSTVPAPAVDNPLKATPGEETAVFAGGCFWGIQAVYQHVVGVKSAVSGYSGGTVGSPSYEEVSSGSTGHAESVKIVFDPSKISYGQLLQVFFSVAHDPTELNRQGPDVGTQYRSAIFYTNATQKKIATAYIDQLTKAKVYTRPIVTQVSQFGGFNVAESYHQNYATLHPNDPYIRFNDAPKVENLRTQMTGMYKAELSSWK